jgi:NAD(P)-dependent dehydrogenase (short-subunit alcohol dehydrogenase family)
MFMTDNQKIALITGASRGLGRNTAIHLAEKGVGVVITYLSNKGEADTAIKEIEAKGAKGVALRLDTSKSDTFEVFKQRFGLSLKETWGRADFDYLVNNAGFGIAKSILETTEEEFDKLVNTQYRGLFFITQKLIPLVKDGGSIVNISSGLTRFALGNNSAYAMTKGGVEVFTRYLARELGRRQITANSVAVGATETDFGGGVIRDNPEYHKLISSMVALGRPGKPDDIGRMIASLLSDDNHWINAQRIEVSGGMSI